MNFRLYNIVIILFFLLSNINVSAQQSNSCGVIARMTPAGDSILHTSSRMTFQSTSINATEYMFFVNGLYYRSDRELDFTFPVGLSKISLVAKNGNCTDTISYYYFYAGTMSSDTTNQRMVYVYSGRTHALNKISTLSSV